MKRALTHSLLGVTLLATPLLAQGPGPAGPPDQPGPRGPQGRGPHAEPRMIDVGYVGVAVDEVVPELEAQLGLPRGIGLAVVSVLPDSPAAKAGLQQHDVLHKLDDQLLVNADQFRTLIQNKTEGDTVSLTLLRQAQSQTLTVTVGKTQAPEFRMRGGPPWLEDSPFPPHMGRPGGEDGPRGPMEGPHGPRGDGDQARPQPQRDGEGPHGPRGQLQLQQQTFSSRSSAGNARFRDNEHDLSLSITDGKKTLIAKDKDGNELFNGPIDTPEQRQAVPEAIRGKLDKLESTRPPQIRSFGPPGERPV